MAAPESATLAALFGHLVLLSLLAMGSALAIAPDLRRVMVSDMGMLTDDQFNASIAIAHAAPGPNVLFVAVAGYQAAGLIGAAVTLLGLLMPSTVLAYGAARWSRAQRELRAVRVLKAAVAPIVITLPIAAGWILIAQTPGWHATAFAIAVAVLVWRTRLHVLVPVAAGAVAGALGWL